MAHVTNKGLAVGGPDDGQVLTYHGTILKRLARPDEPIAVEYSKMQDPALEDSEVFVYYFTSIQMLGRDAWEPNKAVTYGFWVPRETTIEDAMQAVLIRYQEPRRHKNLLRRVFKVMEQLWKAAYGVRPELHKETRDLMEALDKEIHQ